MELMVSGTITLQRCLLHAEIASEDMEVLVTRMLG